MASPSNTQRPLKPEAYSLEPRPIGQDENSNKQSDKNNNRERKREVSLICSVTIVGLDSPPLPAVVDIVRRVSFV